MEPPPLQPLYVPPLDTGDHETGHKPNYKNRIREVSYFNTHKLILRPQTFYY